MELVNAHCDFAAADQQDFGIEKRAEVRLLLSEFKGGFDLVFHDVILSWLGFCVELEENLD